MGDKLRVSVITVCYNCGKVIEKTLESVINQTYKSIEYVIVDGGSTDDTLSILKKYNNRINILMSEPDKGVYDAMNKGVKLASGDWVLFMNAGDVFYSNDVVERIFSNVVDPNVEILFGDTMNDNNGVKKIIKYGDLKRHKYMPSCHQSIFVKRDTLLTAPFDLNFKVAADYLFFYNCFIRGAKRQYVPIVVAIYDVSEGVSHNAFRYSLETTKIEFPCYMWAIIVPYRYMLYYLKKFIKKIIPFT